MISHHTERLSVIDRTDNYAHVQVFSVQSKVQGNSLSGTVVKAPIVDAQNTPTLISPLFNASDSKCKADALLDLPLLWKWHNNGGRG